MSDLRNTAMDLYNDTHPIHETINRVVWEAFAMGVIEGMKRYAWWKDGVEYVGNCGKTLRDAIAEVERELK